MITTRSAEKGITFVHDSDPTDSEVHLVLELNKVNVEMDNFNGVPTCTIALNYNTLRDFVLMQTRGREIEKLESMSGVELAAYYSGDWAKLDKLQGR